MKVQFFPAAPDKHVCFKFLGQQSPHVSPPFFLPENNSKQTFFFTVKRQRSRLFNLFFVFLAHVGSSLPPSLLAGAMGKGQIFTTTSLGGNETFGFTVLDRTRRSTGREGRVKGSKVTVFNSKGFHATLARSPMTARRRASC